MGRNERRHKKMMDRLSALSKRELSERVPESPEVDVFFADDSRQAHPSRPGMGPLIAIGGLSVPAEEVGPLTKEIDGLCKAARFPAKQEFKWSPGRELWMWDHLKDIRRRRFFQNVLDKLAEREVVALVVIADEKCSKATDANSHEADIARLFLERVEWECARGRSHGFVIADRPSGNRRKEEAFLADCLETLQSGTKYMKLDRIAHNVLSTPSNLSRLLQAADLVTSCTLAMVSGEQEYAPPVFEKILPLLSRESDCVGGRGLKIHPDFKYANLYHWIAGDKFIKKGTTGHPLPLAGWKYAKGPFDA